MTLPLYSATARPEARYDAAIGDLLVNFALAPSRAMQLDAAPLEAPRVDTASNPEEFVPDAGKVFARNDFTGGEGLRIAHARDLPEGADRRFWDSRNVDPGPRAGTGLNGPRNLHGTELADAAALTGLRMVWTGSRLMRAGGTLLRVAADPVAGVFSDENPHAGEGSTTILDVAAHGTTEYMCAGHGIHRKLSGGAWEHWNGLAASRLWVALDRLIARSADGRSIYEVTSTTTPTTALLTVAPGEQVTGVAEHGAAILACSDNGTIYAIGPNESTLALEPKAQTRVAGEQVTAIASAKNYVFFATRSPVVAGGAVGRLYRAVLSGSLVLEDQQTLREWGDDTATVDHSPAVLAVSREAVYTVVRFQGEAQCWRYSLDGAGMARWWIFDVDAACSGAALVEGRLFAGIDGSGVWRRSDTYVAGWLIGPYGDHFDAGDKNWVDARLEGSVLPSGGSIELYVTSDIAAMTDPDHAAWRRVRRHTSGTPTGEEALSDVVARGVAGMAVLTPPTSESVEFQSFGFRMLPGGSDEVLDLAIDVGDQVERRRGRRPHRVRGRGHDLFKALRAMRGQAVTLRIFDLDDVLVGQIERVAAPVEVKTDRGSITQFCLVRFRGQLVTDAPELSDGGAWGLFGWGRAAWGGTHMSEVA